MNETRFPPSVPRSRVFRLAEAVFSAASDGFGAVRAGIEWLGGIERPLRPQAGALSMIRLLGREVNTGKITWNTYVEQLPADS